MADYLAQIEAELVHHRAEITKLEIALEVVKRLDKKPAKAEKPKPLFTVRKTSGATMTKHDDLPSAAESRQTVLDFLAQGPMTSGDINDRLGYSVKYQKQRVYSTLNGFMQAGIVERDEEGLHRLVAKPDETELPSFIAPPATTSQAA